MTDVQLLNKQNNMSAIGAAAIAGAAALGGSALSSIGAAKANKLGAQLTREARDYDFAMWNRTNEYNSPSQQMQRLREAGLNPNLIYGNGATHTAQNLPSAKVPEVQNTLASMGQVNLVPTLSMYQDMQVKKAQIDNVNSQTKLNNERIATEILNQGFKAVSTLQGKQKLGLANRIEDYQVQAVEQNMLKLKRDIQTQNFNEWLKREMLPYDKENLIEGINLRRVEKDVKELEYNYQKDLRDFGLPMDTPWWAKSLLQGLKRNVPRNYNPEGSSFFKGKLQIK